SCLPKYDAFLGAASVTPLAAASQQQRGVPRGCSAAAPTTSANVERAEGLSRQRHAIKTFFLGVFLRSLQRDQVFVLGSSSFGGGSYTISCALLRLACSARRRNAQPKFSSSVRFSGSLSYSALASNSAARNR